MCNIDKHYTMKKIYFFLAAMCCAAMMSATEGALSGKFTIDSEGNKVAFSQGNLQYFAPYGRWQFAENQWDYIGGSNDPYATVDLFSWGTGGEDPVIFYTSTDNNDFLSDREWGSASISNGGNEDNLWRTLTMDEWDYLFCGRPNASTRFGFGTVNNVKGLIILPVLPSLPAQRKGWRSKVLITKTLPRITSPTILIPMRNGQRWRKQEQSFCLPEAREEVATSIQPEKKAVTGA